MGWEGRGKSILVKQRENFIVVIFAKIKEANEKKSEKKCYLFIYYQSCMFLLFSDVPRMATPPDGITSPVGSISVMNALTITTEGLFSHCWRFL